MKRQFHDILQRLDSDRATRFMSRVSFFSIVAMVSVFGGFNLDRTPPIEVEALGEPPAVTRGGMAEITAKLTVNPKIECERTTTRWVVDSKGVKHFLSEETISKQARTKMIETNFKPSIRKYPFRAPVGMSHGEAIYTSRSLFNCAPGQEYFPIPYEWSAPFVVVEDR